MYICKANSPRKELITMLDLLKEFANNSQVVGWAIAFIVFLIVEGITFNALVSIWFAAASLLAMLAAMAGMGFVWQLAIFTLSSIVFLVLTRFIVRKVRKKVPDPTADFDIGKTAIVIEDINNDINEGRAKLDGADWSARSANGCIIHKGEVVKVIRIDGSKLIVSA